MNKRTKQLTSTHMVFVAFAIAAIVALGAVMFGTSAHQAWADSKNIDATTLSEQYEALYDSGSWSSDASYTEDTVTIKELTLSESEATEASDLNMSSSTESSDGEDDAVEAQYEKNRGLKISTTEDVSEATLLVVNFNDGKSAYKELNGLSKDEALMFKLSDNAEIASVVIYKDKAQTDATTNGSTDGKDDASESGDGQNNDNGLTSGSNNASPSDDGQDADVQSDDGQDDDAQSTDGQSADTQSTDGQSADGQSPDGQDSKPAANNNATKGESTPSDFSIEIIKTDVKTGNWLEGAEFQLLDPSGNVVDSWTSSSAASHTLSKLDRNVTYTLHEASAPSGYGCERDISIWYDSKTDHVAISQGNNSVQLDNNSDGAAYLNVRDAQGKSDTNCTVSPKTGDNANIALIAGVVVVAAAAVAIVAVAARKRKQ